MTRDRQRANPFLSGPLAGLFLRTAAPIVALMAMNGLMTVVDAYFLGAFVGAEALGAVSLAFPVFMLTVAASGIVGHGSASVLARLLGAGRPDEARAAFTNSHLLALLVAVVLMTGFALGGRAICDALANGRAELANLSWIYLAILIGAAPFNLMLGLNADALRSEGRVSTLAAVGLLATIVNVCLNWLLIVELGLGVAGSALGTVMAQFIGLVAVLTYRRRRHTTLQLQKPSRAAFARYSGQVLALGLPSALNFMGVALTAAVTLHALRIWQPEHYALTVAAYGVVNRLQAFTILPLLGLNMATQTIVGNNAGARLWPRVWRSLQVGALIALAYGLLIEAALLLARHFVGRVFIDDEIAAAEVARILPLLFMLFFISGPSMIVAGFFQAVGDARRAALLGLARNYLFLAPLTYLLAALIGETGIWLATPASGLMSVLLAASMLLAARRRINPAKL
ncbi:MAG: MATE family efflux transporter [Burkholderiaceae bacterium]